MTVDFVRFSAADGVSLQGWLTDSKSDTAVIHVHGMSGNGYENYFLDDLRTMYGKHDFGFLTFDNRGRGIISSFWKKGEADPWGEGTELGGSCFEIFEKSDQDIEGAISYLKTIGKKKFILQGHSLGGSKVVNYMAQTNMPETVGVVLLAPTDMVGWAKTDPKHTEYLRSAKKLLAEGKGTELVGAQCWLDKTPLSARTYASITDAGSPVDIYQTRKKDSLLSQVKAPMLIVYGDKDIGIEKIDGNIGKWQQRAQKIISSSTTIKIIEGASHSFKNYEDELAASIEKFLRQFV
ncbi:alpha/beta fold hydrolase [Candidatus Saccharibacteria bacterium]|nr:alpha/beta fold hydrolase [Candidatus Saccharibacteria bacterium]